MEKIKECIGEELERFQILFESALTTRVPLADNIIRYFLDRKGKQLRPTLTILAAKMISNNVPDAAIHGAVALELLHNASLVHDDVVDNSMERRGADTINKIWDNKIAVLMGDFFLAKCLTASNTTGSLDVSNILADMVTRLSEGELEQMSNVRTRLLSEEAYFSVISGKTASLFSACLKVGAYCVGAKDEEIDRLGKIGELMGLIFQIRDDIFDYFPSNSEVGKPTGHDIQEGKVTLPLLYALQNGPKDEVEEMKSMLNSTKTLSNSEVMTLVEFSKVVGGIEYAQAKMKKLAFEAKKMLATFEKSPARDGIESLIDYFITRNH